MQVIQVGPATFYIDLPSIIGVYLFADHTCCLIDTGDQIEQIKQVNSYLHEHGYLVKAVLSTHFHSDHCAGHGWLQQQGPCAVYASPFEAAVLENPELSGFSLYTAAPLKVLNNRFLVAPSCQVTHRVNSGIHMINNQQFRAVALPGHTFGQLGWETPDGVCFVGDSLIAPHILKANKMNYIADVGMHINTLNGLKEAGITLAVAGHGGLLDDYLSVITANQQNVEIWLSSINEFIDGRSLSIEDVVAELYNRFQLPLNHSQYFTVRSTASAYLSYLYQQRQALTQLNQGRLTFIGKR
ncbi:MAG: MBL fold metallo-hydrolase [Methylocystaceae bacterium]